eukprot:RCo047101
MLAPVCSGPVFCSIGVLLHFMFNFHCFVPRSAGWRNSRCTAAVPVCVTPSLPPFPSLSSPISPHIAAVLTFVCATELLCPFSFVFPLCSWIQLFSSSREAAEGTMRCIFLSNGVLELFPAVTCLSDVGLPWECSLFRAALA